MSDTKHDNVGLSETEQQALDAEDGEDGGALGELANDGSDEADAGDDATADAGGDEADADDAGDTGKAKAEPKKAEEAPKTTVEDDDDDEPQVNAMPLLDVQVPADLDDQIAAARTERRDLMRKFSEGELTDEEYQTQLDAAEQKLDSLKDTKRAAEFNQRVAQANEKAVMESWKASVNSFFKATKDTEGIDYANNRVLNSALDTVVKDLATAKDDAGNLVHGDKPQRWFLKEAHRLVKENFGIVAVPKGAKASDKPDVKKATAGKAPDLSKVPPAISRAPAAGASDDGGEFANLDGLTGMALERAVARMSPEQQARWAEQD